MARSKDERADPSSARPKRSAEERGAKIRSSTSRILAAAEEVFAYSGYDGATLREVARRAEVPLALVSYHFSGKEGLYRAIFEARAPALVEQRMAGLALADLETDPDRKLDLILKSVLVPILALRATEQKSRFGVLLARELSDPRSAERGIVGDLADPVVGAVASRLAEALPDRSQRQLHWLLQVLIGTLVYVMIDHGRIRALSDGAADPDDRDRTVECILDIILHGVSRSAPALCSER